MAEQEQGYKFNNKERKMKNNNREEEKEQEQETNQRIDYYSDIRDNDENEKEKNKKEKEKEKEDKQTNNVKKTNSIRQTNSKKQYRDEDITNFSNGNDSLTKSLKDILLDKEFAAPVIVKKENKLITDYHYVTFQNSYGENTCYVNVIIHLLYHLLAYIPELDAYFATLYKSDESNDAKDNNLNENKNINKFFVLLSKIIGQYDDIITDENNENNKSAKKNNKQVTVLKTLNMRKVLENISSNKFPLNTIADPIELFNFIMEKLNDYLQEDLHQNFYLELIDEFSCKSKLCQVAINNKYDKDNFVYHIYIDEILKFIEKENVKVRDYKNQLFNYSYKLFLSENVKKCEKCKKEMNHDLVCKNNPQFLLINCVWKESNPIVDDVISLFFLMSLKDELNHLFVCNNKKTSEDNTYSLLGFILYSFTLSHYIICIYNYDKKIFIIYDDEVVKEYKNIYDLIIDITVNVLKANGKAFFYPVMLMYTKDFLYDKKNIKANILNDSDYRMIINKCNEAIFDYQTQQNIEEEEKMNKLQDYIEKQKEIEDNIKKRENRRSRINKTKEKQINEKDINDKQINEKEMNEEENNKKQNDIKNNEKETNKYRNEETNQKPKINLNIKTNEDKNEKEINNIDINDKKMNEETPNYNENEEKESNYKQYNKRDVKKNNDNQYDNNQYDNNQYDNQYENKYEEKYENKNDNKYNNKYNNKYDNNNNNKYESRYDNKYKTNNDNNRNKVNKEDIEQEEEDDEVEKNPNKIKEGLTKRNTNKLSQIINDIKQVKGGKIDLSIKDYKNVDIKNYRKYIPKDNNKMEEQENELNDEKTGNSNIKSYNRRSYKNIYSNYRFNKDKEKEKEKEGEKDVDNRDVYTKRNNIAEKSYHYNLKKNKKKNQDEDNIDNDTEMNKYPHNNYNKYYTQNNPENTNDIGNRRIRGKNAYKSTIIITPNNRARANINENNKPKDNYNTEKIPKDNDSKNYQTRYYDTKNIYNNPKNNTNSTPKNRYHSNILKTPKGESNDNSNYSLVHSEKKNNVFSSHFLGKKINNSDSKENRNNYDDKNKVNSNQGNNESKYNSGSRSRYNRRSKNK